MPVFLIFSDYEKAIGIRKFIKKYKLKNTICKKNKYLKYSNCLHARVAPQAFLLDKNGHTLYSGKIDDRIQVLGKKNFNIQAHYLLDNLNAFIHHQTLPFCDNEPLGCLIEY